MDLRWFTYLTPGEKPDGEKRRALLDSIQFDEPPIIVCKQTNFRKFTAFREFMDLGVFLWKYTLPAERCCYEVIPGDAPMKLFMDLECKRKQVGGISREELMKLRGTDTLDFTSEVKAIKKETVIEMTEEEADECVNQLVDGILKLCPDMKRDEILVFSSHGTSKLSYHVITDKWCFQDMIETKAFIIKLMEVCPPKCSELIDLSVYTTNRQLRIYTCCKYKDPRYKQLSHISPWKPPNIKDEAELFQHILGVSLVVNSSHCHLLPSFTPKVEKSIFEGESITLTQDEVNQVMAIAQSGRQDFDDVIPLHDFPFKLRDIKGSMILLTRLHPSHCDVCNRTHDNEHPYLSVWGDMRRIYFNCRRSNNGESQFIGMLGMRLEDKVVQSLTDDEEKEETKVEVKEVKAITPNKKTETKKHRQAESPVKSLTSDERLSRALQLQKLYETLTPKECLPNKKPDGVERRSIFKGTVTTPK